MTKFIILLAILALALTACTSNSTPSGQEQETEAQQSGYEALVANQPTREMNYSPTRETINFWIDTWDEPGKLSFVYLMAANGQNIGYYVFEGLPVSYCASQTPNYRVQRSQYGNLQLPAPAMDGVYYSGAECDVYYGRDASTGTYMEFSAGQGINFMLFEEPLPRQDLEPLGFTTIEDVEDGSLEETEVGEAEDE